MRTLETCESVMRPPAGVLGSSSRSHSKISITPMRIAGVVPRNRMVLQSKVYGLLGNANGPMGEDDLATRNRMVLKQPVTFEELYHPYANSWRRTARVAAVEPLR